MKALLLAVGGTGGHIYPAVAVGETARKMWPELTVAIAGNPEGREAKAAADRGFAFAPIRVVRAPKSAVSAAKFPAALSTAVGDGRAALRKFQPGVVLGFGGYVSFPTVAAALLSKVPVYLHEQNLTAGRANRILGRFATGVFASFEGTVKAFGDKATYTGNPCRFDGTELPDVAESRMKLGLDPETDTLFVFGGSQGAASLNRAAVEFSASAAAEGSQVLHLCGAGQYESVKESYRKAAPKIKVELRAYLEEMELAYAAASLVVCRAGATTITEVACFGVPAALAPYPFATENHQETNARQLTDGGAALLVRDAELTGAKLGELARGLMKDKSRLAEMRAAARRMYKPESARAMAETLKPYLV